MPSKPPDSWTVYGVVLRTSSTHGRPNIGRRFELEEEAWRHITLARLDNAEIKAVLVHTTHRPGKNGYHWRPVNKVLVRFNGGKGWWE
jgi:hypothetical protein